MQNCNEDMIFYVPVNSKLQHSPTGISHLNFPHPPFKHMLKCPILHSYKVIKQPFSLSIVKTNTLIEHDFLGPFHTSDNV